MIVEWLNQVEVAMVQLKTLHSFYKRKRDDEQAVVEGEDIPI